MILKNEANNTDLNPKTKPPPLCQKLTQARKCAKKSNDITLLQFYLFDFLILLTSLQKILGKHKKCSLKRLTKQNR